MNVKRMNIGERQVLIQCEGIEVFVLPKDQVSIQGDMVMFSDVPARRRTRGEYKWVTEIDPSVILSGNVHLTRAFICGDRGPNAEGKIELQVAA